MVNPQRPLITYTTPPQPRQVRLDTTTQCTATCLSCHRFGSGRRNGVMLLSQIEPILDDIAKWETPLTEIVPVNYGEFFLCMFWHMLLRTIEQKLPNTNIVIPTNGSELTEDAVKALATISTIKVINFSLNAYLSSTYESFMGLPSSNIKQVEKAIIYLRKHRPDIWLWVSMVYDPAYQSEMEKDMFVRHWDRVGVIPQIIPASNCNRYQVQIKTILPCRSLFSDLVIGYDGQLSSCCFDAGFLLKVGEYGGSVLEAWRNKKLENLRRIHNEGLRGTIPLCANCSFA